MNDRNEILNEYLLGELTGPEREALEKQIESDPQLAAEVAELAPIVARLEELPDEAWIADPPPFSLPGAVQQTAPARRLPASRQARIRPACSVCASSCVSLN